MVSLITREIRDHLIYILACCWVSIFIIGTMIAACFWGIMQAIYAFPSLLLPVLFLGLATLGTAQMYTDRAQRISALLATLAVTRSRVLAARIVVGVLTLLAALVPVWLTAVILLVLAALPAPFYTPMIWEIPLTIGWAGFACYCAGLEVGWTTNKTWLIVGNLLLVALVSSLILSKGFGLAAMLLLALLAAALLVHVWHRFTVASL